MKNPRKVTNKFCYVTAESTEKSRFTAKECFFVANLPTACPLCSVSGLFAVMLLTPSRGRRQFFSDGYFSAVAEQALGALMCMLLAMVGAMRSAVTGVSTRRAGVLPP